MHTTRSVLSCCLAVLLSAICAGTARAQVDTSGHDQRYRLQPSDVLEVHYRYTPEFDQTVTLPPDGFVTLQIVGDLKLRGLTMEEVKVAILEKARRRLNEPEINLVLRDFQKPYFVVGGEVGAPGRFELRGTITAVQAIAMAGGFKSTSKHSQVVLFRRMTQGPFRTELLDLKAAMTGSPEAPNIELLPGDMLMVPQNQISKIERFVKWGSFGVFFNPFVP